MQTHRSVRAKTISLLSALARFDDQLPLGLGSHFDRDCVLVHLLPRFGVVPFLLAFLKDSFNSTLIEMQSQVVPETKANSHSELVRPQRESLKDRTLALLQRFALSV